MSKVIPPGYIDCAYHFSLTGDPENMVTMMAYKLDTGPPDPLDFLIFLRTKFLASWAVGGRLSSYKFAKIVGYVGQDGGPPAVYEVTADSFGTNASAAPPSNCAVLIRKLTALGGRRGRGRMYLPPFMLSETQVTPTGALDGAARTGFEASALGAFLTELHPVLLHDSDGVSAAPAPTTITNLICDPLIATQRRRMRR